MSKQLAQQKCGEAYQLLSSAMKRNNDRILIQQALVLYTEALDLDPNKAQPYLGIAYLFFAMGQHQEAMGLLAQARALEPMNYRVNLMAQRMEKSIQTRFPDMQSAELTRRSETLRQQEAARQKAQAAPPETAQAAFRQAAPPKPAPKKEVPPPPPLPKELSSDLGPAERPGFIHTGPEVTVLQQLLLQLGYPLQKTSTFDKPTFAAVRRFQSEHQLPITGLVDAQTREAANVLRQRNLAEEALRKQLLETIQAFRQKKGLPHSELWRMLNQERLRQALKLLLAAPAGDGLEEPVPKAAVPRPLLQSPLGTPGQAGVTSEGIEVLRLQETLQAMGYEVPIMGSFELQTFTALKQFQLDCRLPASGEADAATRQLLNEKLAARYEEEKTVEDLEKSLWAFQTECGRPRTRQGEESLQRLVREMLFADTLKLTADLGPGNRPGKISQGVEVAVLQHFLTEEGYPTEINRSFDQATFKALSAFQQDEDLQPSGVLDEATRDLINWRLCAADNGPPTRLKAELGPPNRKGTVSRGAEVLLLQKLLIKLGYKVPLSETFDNATAKALSTLQMRQKLPMTGMADRKTRRLLNQHLAKIGLAALEAIEEEEEVIAPLLPDEPAAPAPSPGAPENPFEIVSDLGPPERKDMVSQGAQVHLLQQALRKLGLMAEATGQYDKATYVAVRKLQMSHKLPMTGLVDAPTRGVVNPILAIAREEEALLEQMEAIVRDFRAGQELPHTGIWSSMRRGLISQLLAAVQQPPPTAEAQELAPEPEPALRPLVQSTLGTQGQLGIVSAGIEVLRLQETLASFGYAIPISGTFELQTYTALRQFQQDRSLPVTGEADAPTRNLINQTLAKKYQRETACEQLEQLALGFRQQFDLPCTTALQERVRALIEQILFETALTIQAELGPANRVGKVSQGLEVAILRDFLGQQGFAVSPGDTYDRETAAAVQSFQKARQLPLSGFIDPRTREAINLALSS